MSTDNQFINSLLEVLSQKIKDKKTIKKLILKIVSRSTEEYIQDYYDGKKPEKEPEKKESVPELEKKEPELEKKESVPEPATTSPYGTPLDLCNYYVTGDSRYPWSPGTPLSDDVYKRLWEIRGKPSEEPKPAMTKAEYIEKEEKRFERYKEFKKFRELYDSYLEKGVNPYDDEYILNRAAEYEKYLSDEEKSKNRTKKRKAEISKHSRKMMADLAELPKSTEEEEDKKSGNNWKNKWKAKMEKAARDFRKMANERTEYFKEKEPIIEVE